MRLNVAVQMDPIQSINIRGDSTFAMMLEAQARGKNINPIRVGGQEYFVWLLHTDAMARLWQDSNFRSIVVNGDVRGSENAIFWTSAQNLSLPKGPD